MIHFYNKYRAIREKFADRNIYISILIKNKSLFMYRLIYDLVSNLTSSTRISTRDLLAVVINQKYLFFLNEFIGFHIFWRGSTTEELTSFSSSFRLHLYIEDNNNFSSYMYVVNGCWK